MNSKKLNIALVAHDARKKELIEWCLYNADVLKQHNLFATGTTGELIENIEIPKETVSVNNFISYDVVEHPLSECITKLLSGPLGGDQQIGAMIAEGKLDVLIFFCDNLITQGHQQDVGALTRLASLYNIAFATNRTTADMIITSSLFGNEEYQRIIPATIDNYKKRILK
jgi:methylglyoxal synthase